MGCLKLLTSVGDIIVEPVTRLSPTRIGNLGGVAAGLAEVKAEPDIRCYMMYFLLLYYFV